MFKHYHGGYTLVELIVVIFIATLLSGGAALAAPGDIHTVAGGGVCDGGPATSAILYSPSGIIKDDDGNIYIADTEHHRVRKIDLSGVITTIAGSGIVGFSGDGGPATAAGLNKPMGLAIDASGNVYIADYFNHRIRKIDVSGVISTIAGTGVAGFGGNNGPATSSLLNYPKDVAVDAAGNIYIADSQNHRIRKIDLAGIITTVAGSSASGWFSGDGGPATSAMLYLPSGIAVDLAGNLYIGDTANDRIRMVDTSGIINTIAGNGTAGYSGDGGPATSASLSVAKLTLDLSGYLYFVDFAANRIRKMSLSTGIIETVAGNGTAGNSGDNGPATSAGLYDPSDVFVATSGEIYIVTSLGNVVRRVDGSGIIHTIAGKTGTWTCGDGGSATGASLKFPSGIFVDGSGNIYAAVESRLRKIDTSGVISTFAGTIVTGFAGDGGPAVSAQLWSPTAVAGDRAGNIYIADSGNDRVRKVNGSGTITTFAGNGSRIFSGDGGPAASASVYSPNGIAVDASGNVFIADTSHYRVRKVNAAGTISTVAGNGTMGSTGDGGPATAASIFANRIAVDALGNLYIAGGNRVRKVSPSGIIITIAGDGVAGYAGDGGPAALARFNQTTGIAADLAGNVYVSDGGNERVRRIDAAGMISTIAGTGGSGFAGDGVPAVSAPLADPWDVAVDGGGNIYIADIQNQRIRMVEALVDTSPDPFHFTDVTNAGLNTQFTSDAITVSGISSSVFISIIGGEYEVNGSGSWTSAPGTVSNGDIVRVHQISSANEGTTTNTVLAVGGESDTFSVTTADTTPDSFSSQSMTDAPPDADVIWGAQIIVSGISVPVPISIMGGLYSVSTDSSSPFSPYSATTPSTVRAGDRIAVRQVSSPFFNTTTTAVLTIGGVSGTFSVTTRAVDTTPDPYSLLDQTGIALNTLTTSNTVTVTGIEAPAAVSITGGEYEINGGGAWTVAPGTVVNGNSIRVRQTSSSSPTTMTDTVLTIGGVSDTFSVTTGSGSSCAVPIAPGPDAQGASAINDLGEMVWSQYDPATGYYQLYSSARGQLTSDLSPHDMPSVNNRGDVVWEQKYPWEPFGPIYGTISGQTVQVTAADGAGPSINDSQEIVWSRMNNGFMQIYSNRKGYLTTDLIDHWYPSINNAGDIVWAQSNPVSGWQQVYKLAAGTATPVQVTSDAVNHGAVSISNSGEIVWSEGPMPGPGVRVHSSTRGILTSDACPAGDDHVAPSVNSCGDVVFTNMTNNIGTIYRLGNSSPCVTDAEPNNMLPEATLVSGNSTTTGMVQDPGDNVDWYKFTANTGDQIKVTVNWAPTVAPNMLMVELMDQSGMGLAGAPEPGSPKTITYTASYSGTYHVHLVAALGSRIGYTLTLKVGIGGGTCADPAVPSFNDQRSSSINDLGEMVWSQYDPATGYYQLYSSARGQLTSDLSPHDMPSVNNRGDVVWARKNYFEPEGPIYGIIGGQQVQLSATPGDHPSINDTMEIVWSQWNNGRPQIYSNKRGYLTTDFADHWSPSINNAGDAVWTQFDPISGRNQIFKLKAGESQPVQMTSDAVNHGAVSISNSGEIVWQEGEWPGQRIRSSMRGGLTFGGCPAGDDHIVPSVNVCGDVVFTSMTNNIGTIYRMGNSSPCVTDAEPNNMHPEATLVSGNTTTMGMVQNPGDSEDWYKFTANTGDQITVTVNWAPTVAPNMLLVDLMNKDGGWLANAPEPGSPKTITYTATYSGPYYVHLLTLPDSKVGYTLTLKVGIGSGTCADPAGFGGFAPVINDLGETVWSQYDWNTNRDQIYSSTRGQLTDDVAWHEYPALNNRGDVVWEQKNNPSDLSGPIFGIISGQLVQVATDGSEPSINNDQEIIWAQLSGLNWQIYSSRRGFLTNEQADHVAPTINNTGDMVWMQMDGTTGRWQIYKLAAGSSTPVQLTSDAVDHVEPSISDTGEVVWAQGAAPGRRIYSSTRGQLSFDACPVGADHLFPSINSCGDIVFSGSKGPELPDSGLWRVYRLGNNSPCMTDGEPNGNLTEATLVSANSTTLGMVQDPGDWEDWYKFTANTGDQIKVSVNWAPTVAPNMLMVDLMDQSGIGLVSALEAGSPKTITYTATYTGTYHVHLMAMLGSRIGYAVTVNITAAPNAARPASIWVRTATNIATNPVVWGASTTADATYEVEEDTTASFTNPRPVYSGTALRTDVTVSGPGTYYYRVRATKAGYQPSGWVVSIGSTATFTVAKPTSIWVRTTTNIATNPVVWGASATADVTYEVEEDITASFTNPRAVYSGIALRTDVTVSGPGTYYYRVRATKAGWQPSAWKMSIGSTVTLTAAKPASIWVRTSTNITTNPVVWGASATAGVTYEVEEDTTTAFTNPRAVYSGIALRTDVTVNGPGTYYYRVRATKAGWQPSAWKVSIGSTVVLTAAMPASIWVRTATNITTNPVVWGASPTAGVTYEVEEDTTTAFTNSRPVYSGTGLRADVTVGGSGTYYYRVRATKAGYQPSPWKVSIGSVVVLP